MDHKIAILEKVFIHSCTKCNGTGFINEGLCECRKKFHIGVKLLLGGFPLDLLKLEKPKLTDKVLQFFMSNPLKVFEDGLSLYIHGALGIGKTLCSVILAEKFAAAFGVEGVCDYKPHLSIKFMEAWKFVSESKKKGDNKEFYGFWDASLFVLDDLSNEYKSQNNPAYVDKLYETFLRHRISNCLATIITTNVVPKEVPGLYNDKITSLLGIKMKQNDEYKMVGRFVEIKLEGVDYRKLAMDSAWVDYFGD